MGLRDINDNFLIRVAAGKEPGHRLVNKFGFGEVGTTLVPVASSGTYQTPAADVALEIVSDDTNDTSAGTGARTVEVQGVTIAGAKVTQTAIMNGTTPVALSTDLCRVFRIKVLTSGVYATTAAFSHATSTITVSGVVGSEVWGEVSIGFGQSQIAAYAVTSTETAYMIGMSAIIQATKTVDLYLFQRNNYNTVAAPFESMRMIQEFHGVTGDFNRYPPAPMSTFPAFTDIIVMGQVSVSTAEITATMQLLIIEDGY